MTPKTSPKDGKRVKIAIPEYLKDIPCGSSWFLVRSTPTGKAFKEPLQPTPMYPRKKMRLEALRAAATIYNKHAKLARYGRLTKAQWYERYVQGMLPDLFTQVYHEIMGENGYTPDPEAVKADIEKRRQEAAGVPRAILDAASGKTVVEVEDSLPGADVNAESAK